MRREARQLLNRALDSMVLAIEHFNRPHDRGRPEAVLILADHSFEMLLKSAILWKGGRIRKPKATNTLGFDGCLNACLLDPKVKFLAADEVDTLRILNSLRDGAQHHLIIISEQQLYMVIQAGATLFDVILSRVFARRLVDFVPQRVLPISTAAPVGFSEMMEMEVAKIKGLIADGSRKGTELRARVRTLSLIDGALRQDPRQPTDKELNAKLLELSGNPWTKVFPGAAALRLAADGGGQPVSLRITKSEGIPVHLVKDGDAAATVVAIKKVDSLSYYNLNLTQVAAQLSLTAPKALAVVRFLKVQDDEECFRRFIIGRTEFARYSPRAVERMREALPGLDMSKVWQQSGLAGRKAAGKRSGTDPG